MLAAHAAMRDRYAGGLWHLVDVSSAAWPLLTRCGHLPPDPMSREVKAARHLAVDQACPACLSSAAAAGIVPADQVRGA